MNNIYLSHFRISDLNESYDQLTALSSLLGNKINQRINKIWGVKGQIRSICSKLMIYHSLHKINPEITPSTHTFQYGKKGNPFVEGSQMNCSISYHKDRIAVAIAPSAKVGIDLEEPTRNQRFKLLPTHLKDKLAKVSINKWNELEAYSKYLGEGLSVVFAEQLKLPTEVEFKHLSINPNLFCCIVSEKDMEIHQEFLQLDELISFTKKQL